MPSVRVERSRNARRLGVGARMQARCMSSFLADALRETATNHGIDRICNDSMSGNNGVVSLLLVLAGLSLYSE